MAKGCCGSGSGCNCLIQAGDGITVTGAGTEASPYKIWAEVPDFSRSLTVEDTGTVNMILWGSGIPSDPFRLSAQATIAMTGLSDVQDPQGGPAVGEVPTWVGVGTDGHWEFKVPPPSPAGAVNVSTGLEGVGSAPSPIKVRTSGTWGVAPLTGPDSTVGLQIYADTDGKLRAQLPTSETVDVSWSEIKNRPSAFPPTAHKHQASDILSQQNLNAGKVNGVRIYSTASSTPPTSPAPAALDLHFFPA